MYYPIEKTNTTYYVFNQVIKNCIVYNSKIKRYKIGIDDCFNCEKAFEYGDLVSILIGNENKYICEKCLSEIEKHLESEE